MNRGRETTVVVLTDNAGGQTLGEAQLTAQFLQQHLEVVHQPGVRLIDPDRQRRALTVILGILEPEVLDLPERVLELLTPRPPGYPRNRELFRGHTDPAFDPLGVAATASSMVVEALLQRERAARLVDFHRRDPAQPGLEAVLAGLTARAFEGSQPDDSRRSELRRVIRRAVADGMLALAVDERATARVRSRVEWALAELRSRLDATPGADEAERAHRALLVADIGRHLERPASPEPHRSTPSEPPPGSPIGSAPRLDQ